MSPRDTPASDLPPAPEVERPAPRPRPPLALLVAITGLGPFTMQVLIPSLPAVALGFGVSYATAQLSLTLYLLGVAVGQLLYGPLSDRYGRKPLLTAGLVLFLVGSTAALLAPTAGWLILARIGQALGGCAGLVLGRAMIRDAYPRERAASVLGYVSTAMAVAPMIAPLLGSLLERHFGWRAAMAACLLFGAALLPAVRLRLPETLANPVPLPGVAGMLGAYVQLLRVAAFRGFAGIVAFSSGVFFAFMTGAPLVVTQGLGHPATTFAAAFMVISVAWSSGSFLAGRLSARLGVMRMLVLGTALTTLGAVLALAANLLLPPGLLAFFVPMFVVAMGNGMTQPNAIAGAVSVRPNLAGTASGVVGAAQMGFGALMTVVTGLAEGGGGLATALVMLGAALGTQLALVATRRATA